ncbi:hypothetical protein ACLB2K_010954 [Fragaria x ananassa]
MELRKFGEDEEADLKLRKVGRMKMKMWIERLGFGGRDMDSWVMEARGMERYAEQKRSVNPEWDEKLTLTVSDPNIPVKLFVYDKDTFTFDDKMGDAEFEIATFVEVVQMLLEGLPEGTIIAKVQPTRQNCLAEESCIILSNGKLVQNMVLRLRNVERGEVELQLHWIHVPMGL